ncbi:uncharacterized protein RAG0_07602 [Rhynchosporium agropyri]|uniref:SprT-like domain-containing protein n=1 Tax=Rhynchosporium agropyri TaxID=914238 RepID=A0A1E1KMD0_9HELO|nr:uncharacterized protein RAG0_07602 [Rhynchosporium agropyri]
MTTTSMNLSMSSPVSLEVAHGVTMERTESGRSIISDSIYESSYDQVSSPQTTFPDFDAIAASQVKQHTNKSFSHRKYERHSRILRSLIDDDNNIVDDVALDSILNSANALFFSGTLKGRVQWEWSSQARYHSELIGTTALRRRADNDGFETLIVLSEPILRSTKYDRRLLLSAFLHELIHCYLFVTCGFEAKRDRGHTRGFHVIARIVDRWVGEGYLGLCSMKANLDNFRRDVEVNTMDTVMCWERDVERERKLEIHPKIMESGMMEVSISSSRGHRNTDLFYDYGYEECDQSPQLEPGGLVVNPPALKADCIGAVEVPFSWY